MFCLCVRVFKKCLCEIPDFNRVNSLIFTIYMHIYIHIHPYTHTNHSYVIIFLILAKLSREGCYAHFIHIYVVHVCKYTYNVLFFFLFFIFSYPFSKMIIHCQIWCKDIKKQIEDGKWENVSLFKKKIDIKQDAFCFIAIRENLGKEYSLSKCMYYVFIFSLFKIE